MLTIGICGAARSGKDTLAKQLNTMDLYRVHSMAGPLKRMIEAGFDLDPVVWEVTELKERPMPWLGKSPRYLAQTLGTEWGRELVHEKLWILLAEQKRKEAARQGRGLIVPDIRFDNEAQWIRSLDNGVVLRVVRDQRDQMDNPSHASEAGISEHLVDITVYNNKSIDHLRNTALMALSSWVRTSKELHKP